MSDYAAMLEGERTNKPLPANTAAPVVSGSGKNGQTLSATTGTWNNMPTPPNVPVPYSYQWRAAAVAINNATRPTYEPKTADVGKAVDCLVTARNVAGAASQASNAITILTNP